MAAVDLRTIQESMGHKDIQMTLRYAHLSPAHKRLAIEVLEQRLSDQSPASFHDTSHQIALVEEEKCSAIQ
jgi:site-specific recombinase XerD